MGLPAWRGAGNLEQGYGLVDCCKWVSFLFFFKEDFRERSREHHCVQGCLSLHPPLPTKQNQWKDLEQSKLCSRAAWPVFPLETYQCTSTVGSSLQLPLLINTSVHYMSLMNMGNDWVPESQVTKNNCAVQRINRFPAPLPPPPSITWGNSIFAAAPLEPPHPCYPLWSSLIDRLRPQSSFIKLVALNLLCYCQWHGAD